MSNYSFKIAAFTCNTSGTRQNITPSGGPGTNPKAAIFVVSGATALDSVTTHARLSVGMTDGTTHLVNALLLEDGTSPVVATTAADTGIRADNTMVISTCLTTSETIDSEASFVAWTNDGVAIDWANFPATALRGHVIFFYGSDLTADVVTFTPSTTQDVSADISGLSFQPDVLIGVSGWLAHSDGGTASSGRISIGAATNYGGGSNIQQSCRSMVAADRNTGTSSIHRSNAFLSRVSTTAEQSYLDVTSFNSDGATIFTRGGSTGNPCAVLALNLNGGRAKVVTELVDTSDTGQKYIETIGFKPNGVLIWGGEAVSSNSFITTEDNGIFVGFGVSPSEAFASGFNNRNGGLLGNARTYSLSTSAGPIGLPNRAAGTTYAATLTAFTHNGLNFNVVLNASADHLMSFLAFEETDARIGADTERISDEGILRVTIDRRVSDDIERIADEFVFAVQQEDLSLTSDDTERVSDDFRLVVTSDLRVISETEGIADAVLFVRTSDRLTSADTEEVTDTFNFIVGKYLTVQESVEISDGFVLVSTGTTFLISSDDLSISEDAVLVPGDGNLVLVASETVELADGVLQITGQVLVTSDEIEAVEDAFSFGRGLIARKAIRRGRVF